MKKSITLWVVLGAIMLGCLYLIFHPLSKTQNSGGVSINSLSADVYPAYPNLTWGKENLQTYKDISGVETVSSPITNISDLSAVSAPFLKYYKDKLTPLGWTVDNSLAAGGPGSELVGYKKGSEYIILKFTTLFKGGGTNEPVQCPCDISFSVFSGSKSLPTSYKNATYILNGKPVTLINGKAEEQIVPGSASKLITQYFGNEVTHDFDGDGRQDVAFLLTQNSGGSGTFFYVIAALNTPNGYVGSEGVLLGDRIAPQTTEMSQNPSQKNVIVVNYAVRKAGESFSIQPSVGKSIWLLLDPKTMQFGEVAQNFEGEADPARMTLGMKKWVWIETLYNNGTSLEPKKVDAFTLTFSPDGNFHTTTDCNSVSGKYTTNKQSIEFSHMVSTLMYCDASQESQFTALLTNVDSYLFTSKGEFVLNLKMDSGSVIFK
jgi:heat shock protein HslJ